MAILNLQGTRQSDSRACDRALDAVKFSLDQGVVVALIGENEGPGKSTLMKILGGVYQPDAGIIEIDGS